MDQIKTGVTLCKAIMRNGYDAYAINAPLQKIIIDQTRIMDVDIACACDPETLYKIFPNAQPFTEEGAMAIIHENNVTLRFYPTDIEDASHPERGQLRITPRMLRMLQELNQAYKFDQALHDGTESQGFEDFNTEGCVKFVGIPGVTLSYNYLLAIRALRYAANFDLPVEPHTWMAIIQSANRILDYVPAREIMEEWRKVAAESMWKFVQLLFDAQILHGLMPEVAALACVTQERNDDGVMEDVFSHTIECMRLYPEDGLSMDWYGVLATMFHDVGKLYTAENIDGRWTFYQHHRVGAGVTRKILRRLHFSPEDIDLICHLVRHHMMFHFMLTDRGIRRFKSLSETSRLISLCRADIKARGGSYTYFNHNQKYLERAETAEIMLEPLLNGNE
ncbi:MAG: HD domain-containing protein, partial [Bilophila sp.]